MRDLKKKTCKYVLAFLLFLVLAGIVDVQPVQAAVKLNTSSVNLCVGDKYQLKLSGTSKKVTWKSSKTSVAKVSSKGFVTAKGKGSATITATCNKKNYTCKVKVNKNFKIDKTSVSIKKNTNLSVYLSVAGGSFYRKENTNPSVCSIEYGAWSGDYLTVTIIPKKVGSTTITFQSRKKKDPNVDDSPYVDLESCTLTVKVTALPSVATFQSATISSDADTLIVGESKFSVPFSLNRASTKTYLRIYDENGALVRNISVGSLAAKKKKTVTWDGKDDDGVPVNGTFTYAVVADGNRTDSKKEIKVLAVSPFGKGDGTKNNPYLVSNLNEFYLMKNYNGAYFAQDADIDFNYEMSALLFGDEAPFTGTYTGTYAGTNYRIMNLCGYRSLFGSIGEKGVVKNVNMSNCLLNTTGSLLADTNKGTIENCTVDGTILCNSGNQAAMLVMYNKGVVRDCTVSGSLTVEAANATYMTTLRAGGIAFQNSGTIAKCTSSVQITQKITVGTYIPNVIHEIYAGGITADNASGAIVTQCVFIGSINTSVSLPDTVKDVTPDQVYKTYSGYVAGVNNGFIGSCTNASMDGSLGAKGTGNGTEQQ